MPLPDLAQPLLASKQYVASLQNGATGFGDPAKTFVDIRKSRKLFKSSLDHFEMPHSPAHAFV